MPNDLQVPNPWTVQDSLIFVWRHPVDSGGDGDGNGDGNGGDGNGGDGDGYRDVDEVMIRK